MSCETILHINPRENQLYIVTYDVDEKTEERSALIVKEPASARL
jgi:hypothetical protein